MASIEFNFQKRVQGLREILKKNHLDAFLVIVQEGRNKNLYYLSGFGGSTGALVVTQKGAVLVVDARYTQRARRETCGIRIVEIPSRSKRRFGEGLIEYVGTALEDAHVSRSMRVGFESHHVSIAQKNLFSYSREFENKFRSKKWATREHLVERMRQVKDEAEIAVLAHAGKVTSAVFGAVAKKIKTGMTEKEIAYLIDMELRKRGATGNSFPTIIASGPNSAVPHHETSGRKMKAGEPVVMDFGGVFEGGYCSDITRTIFVGGKPHKKLLDIYRVVREANKKAARALRAGMMWKEYNEVARRYIEEEGYGKYFLHGVGHSLGLEVHDPYDYARDPFQAGVVVTDEPGIYIEGLGGVRIEDDYVITKKGATCLTPASYLLV